GRDRQVEGPGGRSESVDLAQEVSHGIGRKVADGDDAVVPGGPAQRCAVGPVGGAPDGDAGLLEGSGEELRAVDVKMRAGVVGRLPCPQLRDDLEALVEELGAGPVVGRFPEGAELPRMVGADPDAENEAAA